MRPANETPPPPSICSCGHRRMDHPRTGACNQTGCLCPSYVGYLVTPGT